MTINSFWSLNNHSYFGHKNMMSLSFTLPTSPIWWWQSAWSWSPSDGLLERLDGGPGQQTDRYGPFCIKGRLAYQICCFWCVCWKGRLLWANRFTRKYCKHIPFFHFLQWGKTLLKIRSLLWQLEEMIGKGGAYQHQLHFLSFDKIPQSLSFFATLGFP